MQEVGSSNLPGPTKYSLYRLLPQGGDLFSGERYLSRGLPDRPYRRERAGTLSMGGGTRGVAVYFREGAKLWQT